MASDHILIVGSGSVGKRHARNLAMLGCGISCVDPRADRLAEISSEVTVQNSYTTIEDALSGPSRFDGVVIASPPKYHVGQAAAAVKANLPVLLEKPVSPDLESALALSNLVCAKGVPLLLGYTWRWWEPLGKVRELLTKGVIGNLYSAGFIMSAHLADWHPWEPYQQFFMSSKEQGGGALLDESHWIDIMLWLFGLPSQLFARIDRVSNLQIETDDNVDILAEYPDGFKVTLHLDLYGRPHEKSARFVGEKGTILWSADPNQIAFCDTMEKNWDITTYSCERNEMFVKVAQEFLRVIKGEPVQTCTIEEGIKVMEIIEAVRRSNIEKCMVTPGGDRPHELERK